MRRSIAFGLVVAALAGLPRVAFGGDDGAAAPATAKGVAFERDVAFASLLEKAKAENKPVFVDFATKDCVFCKKLDAEVLCREDVAEAMKAYVAAHIDAEKGEGVDLAKRYHVRGYPTLVVVDAQGEEVDRIVGYRTAPVFLSEVKRIASGEGTLPWLRKRLAADPDDLAAGLALADKESDANPTASMARYDEIAIKAKAKGDREIEAMAVFAPAFERLKAKRFANADEVLGKFFTDFGGTKAASRAASMAVQVFPALYRKKPDALLAALEKVRGSATDPETKGRLALVTAEAHRALAEKSLRDAAAAAADDATRLNEVAWYAYEHKLLVKEATGWARKAVELSKRDPMILDTLACLRAAARAWDEAIALETEAAKTADGKMRAEFERNVAAWKAAKDGKPLADDDEDDDHEDDADDDGEDGDDDGPGAGARPHAEKPAGAR